MEKEKNEDQNKIKKKSLNIPWTASEDDKLKKLVSQHGKNWSIICDSFDNRTVDEIKRRYQTILKPISSHGPFTKEEDDFILTKVSQFGKNWSFIANFLSGRTPVSISNRYSILCNKNKHVSDVNHTSDTLDRNKIQLLFDPSQLYSSFADYDKKILDNNIETLFKINKMMTSKLK